MNGTVTPVLAKFLSKSGFTLVPGDRSVHPIDNREAVACFIACENPDFRCYLAISDPVEA